MSLKIGIVGLPNVGKSTLFQALTKKRVDISNYPFCTIDPNVGVVEVPDERLQALAKLVPQAEVIPAVIEFVDVAGLVRGAAEGEGLGNQFLSHLFPMDALMFLIRCFQDPEIVSVVQDPAEQFSILREELKKKDAELQSRAATQTQQMKRYSVSFAGFEELSNKPYLMVCNIKGDTPCAFTGCGLQIDGKLELELSEMTEKEQKELELSPELPKLISAAYKTLDLITFYTLKGGKELRAWPLKRGSTAPEAGGVVHSDFKEKFIRAEVIDWEKLVAAQELGEPRPDGREAGSWTRAKEFGWIRTEGKEYVVQDGDVIEFRI